MITTRHIAAAGTLRAAATATAVAAPSPAFLASRQQCRYWSAITATQKTTATTTTTTTALRTTTTQAIPAPAATAAAAGAGGITKVFARYNSNSSSASDSKGGQQEGEIKKWTFEQLRAIMNPATPSGVVIVDVREPEELKREGWIPGAINVPVTSKPDSWHMTDDEFEAAHLGLGAAGRPAKDREVVFYCKAGVRSRTAATLARDAGWTNVGEYPGSWVDWVKKGGRIEQ
ncbi:thiosulfate:glutathione sulfurtransferase [Microdochium nivale]|nr:thiosulfate:glutathione sulfurtransferase [Microdochium nivale]